MIADDLTILLLGLACGIVACLVAWLDTRHHWGEE
jgi:hypothetical protein